MFRLSRPLPGVSEEDLHCRTIEGDGGESATGSAFTASGTQRRKGFLIFSHIKKYASALHERRRKASPPGRIASEEGSAQLSLAAHMPWSHAKAYKLRGYTRIAESRAHVKNQAISRCCTCPFSS